MLLDPLYVTQQLVYWLLYPYYWSMYLEMYRTMVDAWRRLLESLVRAPATK